MHLEEELITRLWLEELPQAKTNQADVATYHHKKFSLPQSLVKKIKLFCKKQHISWEIFIHTAWGLLLNRLSTTEHSVFASCQGVVDRNGKPFASLLHFIHCTTDLKLTIPSLIKQIKKELIKKKRSTPILINKARYLILTKTSLTNKKELNAIDINQFPLILNIDKKIYAFTLYFHSVLFNSQEIESINDHLKILIDEICSNTKSSVYKLNILTKNEKNQLLSLWNKPGFRSSSKLFTICIHDLFAKQAVQTPNQIAVQNKNETINYEVLTRLSNQLALDLMQKGVKPGDHICSLMDRTPTLILAMLAVFKIGAVFVPINLKYPKERIEYVLDDCQPARILVNRTGTISKKYSTKIFSIAAEWKELNLPLINNQLIPQVSPEQDAYIIYTSGTTGNPKGVVIKHASLINLTNWYVYCFKISNHDRASQFASQGFDTFFCETLPYLATGGSIHIVDDNTKLTPSSFFPWLIQNKITICDLPTAYAQLLFNMSWPAEIKLRILKIGGESITHYPEQRFPFDIWNTYGPTETTIETTYVKIYTANTVIKTQPNHPPPIGKPIANSEMYVVDKYLQLVPVGICGELLIGGIGLTSGYWHREELNREKFVDNIFSKNSYNKLYRTGDLVRWLSDGNLEFIGRVDHQVKIRGYRIELSEIEASISHHPDVNEVVVLTKEDIHGEKSLIAYVTPNLDKTRYLYQERCLLSTNNDKFFETLTEDISKNGIALSGLSEEIQVSQFVRVHLKIPGLPDPKTFSGHCIWYQDHRCGINFDLNEDEKSIIEKSIAYYLSMHNVMELVLSTSAKRSLRKALRKKLPEYMVPSAFVTLMEFPLTFSGKVDSKSLPPPQEFEKLFQKKFIPPKTNLEKKLAIIWGHLLKQANISMVDNFFDLGGNSLLAAQLSTKILERFHISIPTHILFDLSYIPILAEYIQSKGKNYTNHSIIQDEISHDAKLPDNITPNNHLSENVQSPQNILLTGAGGFLGIYLLRELLLQTDAKIHCIIRRGAFESAAKRLQATIEKFNLSKDVSLANRQIIAIAGDISFDHFGLPQEQYLNLADKIDLIYHCGAQVNIMTAYHKLRGSNVQGTLEIIKFATKKIDKPIHYVSTLTAACRKNSKGDLIEDFPNHEYEGLFGGYAISKWISERLLTQLKDRGSPASIYRSGYILGQSDNGMTNLNDAFLMLIKGCIQLGYAPKMDEIIAILPVDFVSKAITKISLAHPATPLVYHIDHPHGILWLDLIAWLVDYGYKIKLIPQKLWKEKLIHLPQDNALFPFLPYYLSLDENQKTPGTDITIAHDALKKLNLPYPKIDHHLLKTYVEYLCKVNFLPYPKALQHL